MQDRVRRSRRDFLKLVPVMGVGAALAACSSDAPDPTATPSRTPTVTPPATQTPAPAPTATAAPSPTATPSIPLEEQIGELLMLGFRGFELSESRGVGEALRARHLGSVVLFDHDLPSGSGRNIESPSQVQTLTEQVQNLHGGGVLIATDEEGGLVARLGPDHGFPATVAPADLGEVNDIAYTREVTEAMAATLAEAGINLNLAPVVDLNLNPANPVIGSLRRSFSADPDVVTQQATAFIEAHHAQDVLCTLKHFPGHGSSEADSHLGFVDVTNLWSPVELEPFRNLIDAGLADAIMTAHIFNANLDPDLPATLSRATITGVLREELGYDGVVITDDMQMGAIRDYYGFEAAVEMAINAGADVIAVANNTVYDEAAATRAYNAILTAVQAGRISEARIVESYQRVRRLKQRLT